jgi:hypothetical protein
VPGKKTIYEVDIREFLLTNDNAVVRKEIDALAHNLSRDEQTLFRSRKPGSFDFRVDQILKHMGSFRYGSFKKKRDPWLFPDETLSVQEGDCEDLALVLGALIIASGVSPYCIRVALGKVRIRQNGRTHPHDHA